MDVPSDLLKAPGGKYPAKEHAAKVLDLLRMDGKVHSYLSIPFLYLVSQKTRMIEDNDEAMPFRWVVCWIPFWLDFYSTVSLFV